MNKLYIIGIGPGGTGAITGDAIKALNDSELITAYTPYLEYVKEVVDLNSKSIFTSGMMKEIERCTHAVESASKGITTSIISTGDAGLYGMAGPCYEIAEELGIIDKIEIIVIPGVSAIFAAAAELGAPLMHDTAIISLSDLLTPLELIKKRLDYAALGDFVIGIYNPRSKKRPDNLKMAIDIIAKHRDSDTPVGIVRNAGRAGTQMTITDIASIDYEAVDMLSLVIVGNTNTRLIDGKIVTPRGYENK